MWQTETHTRKDKWGRATKEWAQNVESTENARVAPLKRDASTIALGGYDTCAQPMICKMDKLLSQVCYVCMVPGVSLKMIQDDRIWQSYMQCGMMLWHLLTSSLLTLFFSLLKSLFFFSFVWPLLHNAQTKIAIVYMREQTCDTRYDSNICTTMIWYVCYGKYDH